MPISPGEAMPATVGGAEKCRLPADERRLSGRSAGRSSEGEEGAALRGSSGRGSVGAAPASFGTATDRNVSIGAAEASAGAIAAAAPLSAFPASALVPASAALAPGPAARALNAELLQSKGSTCWPGCCAFWGGAAAAALGGHRRRPRRFAATSSAPITRNIMATATPADAGPDSWPDDAAAEALMTDPPC
jgi:hypothetical protein